MHFFRTLLVVPAALTCLLVAASPGSALTNEEKDYLSLYFSPEELVVQSATRSPEPISHVAENMTVVTAVDIERMNAHTLADVLNTVTGFEVWFLGGPGQIAQGSIMGSENRHVAVIMDGVVLNYIGSSIADLGTIPVQNIEKIEIIKGPASAAWGSALGGVVNIITKSGRTVDQGGVVYGSAGTNGFGDYRVEDRGKQNGLGYYLTAGRLEASGLTKGMSTAENNAYTKLSYDLTDNTSVLFALDYHHTKRDDGILSDFDVAYDEKAEHLHTTLGLVSAISKSIDFDLSLWSIRQSLNTGSTTISTGAETFIKDNDKGYGSTAKLTYKGTIQTIVVGADSDERTEKYDYLAGGEQSIRKWAFFANDTLSFNKLTVTPGIRFDHTNSNGNFTSPSFGVTYNLEAGTILRAFTARGFSIPTPGSTSGDGFFTIPNPNLDMETVWSYQGGIESAALKYLWLKLMAFRNDIRNGLLLVPVTDTTSQIQNIAHQRREGLEVELKTAPVYNTSLSAGAEFISAKDLDTGEHLTGIPVQIYDVGIRYDDQNSFKATLLGRHMNWNAADWELSKYHSILLDLTMSKRIYQRKDLSLELFAEAHNLLNTPQYLMYVYPNPERWYEAGVRCKF